MQKQVVDQMKTTIIHFIELYLLDLEIKLSNLTNDSPNIQFKSLLRQPFLISIYINQWETCNKSL